MKKMLMAAMIVTVLSFGVPFASAENSADLDPMVSPDAQATVKSENASTNAVSAQASNVVSSTDAVKKEEATKKGKSKKQKAKKKDAKKTTTKSTTKSSPKKAKKTRKPAAPVTSENTEKSTY